MSVKLYVVAQPKKRDLWFIAYGNSIAKPAEMRPPTRVTPEMSDSVVRYLLLELPILNDAH